MSTLGTKRRVAVLAVALALAGTASGADAPDEPSPGAGIVGDLLSSVDGLVDAGTLTPRGVRSLRGALSRSAKALSRGDERAAATFLAAYVRGVGAAARNGTLTAAQAEALAVPARAIVGMIRDPVRGRIAPTGSSGAARGDFDHDGFGDLAVAAPNQTVNGRTGAGAVYVVYGTADGLSAARAQTWTQETAGAAQRADRGAHFGSALASGDFDGDGFTDLAIGAPGSAAGAGHVDVLFGSASGVAALRTEELDVRTAGLARDAGGEFGAALAWADFNGDGVGDLCTGAPGYDWLVPRPGTATGEALVRDAGLVCVFFGSASGLLGTDGSPAAPPQLVTPRGTSVAAGSGADVANAGDRFGAALATGRFDAGPFADLAIAAPFADVTLPTGVEGTIVPLPGETTFVDAGRVHLVFGSAAGLDVGGAGTRTLTEDTFLGPGIDGQPGRSDYGDRFGTAVSAGDLDGDGVADLAIGAPLRDRVAPAGGRIADAGAVYVLYGDGSVETWTQGGALADAPEAGDRFGSALADGDFDGDGRKDLAIGAPFEDLAVTGGGTLRDCGVVHVIHGSAAGLDGARTQILRRPGDFADAAVVVGTDPARKGDRFGAALTAWNFNGIPSPAELAVGVPFADVAKHRDSGAVEVVYGRPGGLDAAGAQTWRPSLLGFTDERGALFGATLY